MTFNSLTDSHTVTRGARMVEPKGIFQFLNGFSLIRWRSKRLESVRESFNSLTDSHRSKLRQVM